MHVSRPYYVYRLQLLAHKYNADIQGWSDLGARGDRKPKSVGVLGGSAAHEYTKELFGDRIDLKINPDVATVIGLVKDKTSWDTAFNLVSLMMVLASALWFIAARYLGKDTEAVEKIESERDAAETQAV